jgi:gliding motility-associated-like protein
LPTLPTTTNGERCGPGQVTVSASGAGARVDSYVWYYDMFSGEPIPNEVLETYTTTILNETTIYYVSIANSFCETARVPVTAIINPIPAKPVITSNIPFASSAYTICTTKDLKLSAPDGFSLYGWSTKASSQEISATTTGTYLVRVTDANGCISPTSDPVSVTVIPEPCDNVPPAIESTSSTTVIGGQIVINLLDLISDADDNLLLGTLSIIGQPTSGAQAILNKGVLEIDYTGIAFSGREYITIQVCDAFSECTQQQIEIDVAGEIEIYNGMSPNSDQRNEIFLIKYIEILEATKNNKVTIFDRWGTIVFEVDDYNNTTNVFKGISNKGKELPTGTYFYKIDFKSLPSKTGYISLKR